MTDDSDKLVWQAESLRVTAFLVPGGVQPAPQDWWKNVTGSDPDTRTDSPKKGGHRQEGDFLSGRLVLNVELGRVDWIMTVDPRTEEGANSLGPLLDVAPKFVGAIKTGWLAAIETAVQRLAVGIVATQPTADRTSGYQALARLLPDVKIDAAGSRDFFFQINRPRMSKVVGDLEINRISKWSVGYGQMIQLMFGGITVAAPGPESFMCRLEQDVNTTPRHVGTLENREGLLVELLELAAEVASKGDIR